MLTVHHWSDPTAGLRELARVSRRQVVLFFEPLHTHDFWCLSYFPEAVDLPSERRAPGEAVLRAALDVRAVRPVLDEGKTTAPVPRDLEPLRCGLRTWVKG